MRIKFERLWPETGMLLVVGALRLFLAHRLELAPDESYYFTWSRHLAAGYLDHPPAIAFVIAAGTALLGRSPLGVRSGLLVCGLVSAALTCHASWLLFRDRRRARWTLAAALALPLANVGGVLATPDAPLTCAWSIFLWGLIFAHSKRSHLGWWISGIGAGLACLAKYNGILLLIMLPLIRPGSTWSDRRVSTWCAVGLAVALFSPNLVWNAHHGWISITFQAQHGLRKGATGGVSGLLEFLAGQLVVVGPAVFLLCLGYWYRASLQYLRVLHHEVMSRSEAWTRSAAILPETTLLFSSLIPFLLFSMASLRTRGEANWIGPAYLAALIAIPWTRLGFRWRAASIGGGVLITLLLALQATLPLALLPARLDPTSQFYGWTELGNKILQAPGDAPRIIITERYQEASELAFQGALDVAITALPGRGRPDQYDLWPAPKCPTGSDALWLNKAGAGSNPPFGGFSVVEPPELVTVGRMGQTRSYHVYRLRKAVKDLTVDALPTSAVP